MIANCFTKSIVLVPKACRTLPGRPPGIQHTVVVLEQLETQELAASRSESECFSRFNASELAMLHNEESDFSMLNSGVYSHTQCLNSRHGFITKPNYLPAFNFCRLLKMVDENQIESNTCESHKTPLIRVCKPHLYDLLEGFSGIYSTAQ